MNLLADAPVPEPITAATDHSRTEATRSPRRSAVDIGALAFLGALVAFVLAPVIFRGEVLLPVDLVPRAEPWHSAQVDDETDATEPAIARNPLISDALWEAYPMAVQAQRLWRDGLPLWDPTAMIGMPALAAGKMYTNPVYLLLATILRAERAMSWSAVVHLLIAALGMFLLLREIGARWAGATIGALAFTFNGYVLAWLSLTYFAGTMVWTPLLVWSIERALRRRDPRWLCVGAGIFALQILAGFVLFAAHSGLVIALYFGSRALWRVGRDGSLRRGARPALYGAAAVLGGMALAAFQFLPALELFGHSSRSGRQLHSVIPLHEAVRLLVPGISGTPLAGGTYDGTVNYAETALYFGIVPMLCLFAGLLGTSGARRRAAWLWFGVGLLFWLAVYGVAPFHAVVGWITPGFHATFAGRVFFLVAFAWSMAAGLGADALLRRPSEGTHRNDATGHQPKVQPATINPPALLGAVTGVGVSLLVLRTLGRWWPHATQPLNHPETLETATTLVIVSGAVVALVAIRRLPRALLGVVLVGLTAGDLVRTHGDWNPSFDVAEVLPTMPRLEALGRRGPNAAPMLAPMRVAPLDPRSTLPGMAAQAFGLSSISGYSSWILSRYSRYATLTRTRYRPRDVNRIRLTTCCGPLLDALAVERVLAGSTVPRLDLPTSLLAQLPAARHQGPHLPTANRPRLQGGRREALFQHAPSRLAFDLDPPGPVRMTAALGLDWRTCSLTDGVEFEVRVRTADGKRHQRFHQALTPVRGTRPAWVPIEVDLVPKRGANTTAKASRVTQVVLVTKPGPRGHASCDWALWGEPQLHHAPPLVAGLKRMAARPTPIYRNREALARARLVHRVVTVPPGDLDAAATQLAKHRHELATMAVVEGTLTGTLGPATLDDRAQIVSFAPRQVTVDTESNQPALLVLAEAFHPGWQARVDGVAAPVLATNLAVRGVPVPAGRHRVIFSFRPRSFRVGCAIAIFTVLTVVGVLLHTTRRRRGDARP